MEVNNAQKAVLLIDQKTLLAKLIAKLEHEKFYGELIFNFERGKLVTIRQKQVLKLDDL